MRAHFVLLSSIPCLLWLSGCQGFGEKVSDLFSTTHREHHDNGKVAKEGKLSGGEQVGPWKYYYETGPLRAEGSYAKDIPDGRWTYYYRNGNKEMEGSFTNERREGLWRYYHRVGTPRAQGRFDRGRETGEWIFWDRQGERDQRGDFEQGKRAMQWTYWHSGGSRKAQGYYLRGKRVGVWKFWDKDGAESQKTYATPDGHELVRENWPGGSLRREGFTAAGTPVGRWITYHQNGERRIAGDFVDGQPDGAWLAWDENGEQLAAGPVAEGKITGDWRVWVNGEERGYAPDEVRPSGPTSDQWSEDSMTRTVSPEVALDTWLAEICFEVEEETRVAQVADSTKPGPASWLEKEVAAKKKVPIRAQPWTVREQRNLQNYLDNYGTGANAGRRSSGRYGRATARARKGDTERSEMLIGQTLPKTQFDTADGQSVDIAAYQGQKKVLLLILRGFAGQVCVYCATQTRALAPSFDQFQELDTEVLVVYPGPESGLDAFLEAYAATFGEDDPPPYTLLYDPDLELARKMGIVGDLAIPTTVILDETGKIHYAYVGEDIEDRPPAKVLIETLRKMENE